MLEGELHEEIYHRLGQASEPQEEQVLVKQSCSWTAPGTTHRIGNNSDRRAVSLHIYSPPLVESHAYLAEDLEADVVTVAPEILGRLVARTAD